MDDGIFLRMHSHTRNTSSPSTELSETEKRWWRAILENDHTVLADLIPEVNTEQDVETELVQELKIKVNISTNDEVDIPHVTRITPLPLAAACGSTEVLECLVNNGADTENDVADGQTALHLACIYGQARCVKVLVQAECDVNAQTSGDSPLMLAVACFRDSASKQRYLEIATRLLDIGCDVNLPDDQGFSPIHLAAGKEDPAMLDLLIRYGADVNVKMISSRTPLLCAVAAGLDENVRLLLAAGCKVNDVAFPDITALSTALAIGSVGMILDLLEAGADPKLRSDTLDVHIYLSNKQYVVVLVLLAYGLDVNWQTPYDKSSLLVSVTRMQCIPLARLLLLQYGADCELDTKLGTTPLWAAVKCNNIDLVKTFLIWNCDLNVFSLEFNPFIPISPIQLALISGNREVAGLLLHYGCRWKPGWLNNEPLKRQIRNNNLAKWLQDNLSTVKSLTHYCMLTIRKSIGPKLPLKVRKLHLPSRLKSYVISGHL